MSVDTDLDYSLWEMYLQECRALEIRPSMSDYSVFLQELNLDRSEHYED